jgi:hypothetical protein
LGGRKVGRDLLGVVHNNENEEEMLYIQKREGSSDSKSETPIEMEAVAIEAIEGTAKDLRMYHKMDRTRPVAISECLRTDYKTIEGMKNASEIGDFDITKVGRTDLVSEIARRNEGK